MKKALLLLTLSALSVAGYSQCNQKLALESSKTEYLDGAGTVQRSVDETSTLSIGTKDIVIVPGGQTDHQMNGTIESVVSCEWSVPYKTGKTVLKAVFGDISGDQKHATLTIEGKDGALTFLMEIDEFKDKKIRVNLSKFEAAK